LRLLGNLDDELSCATAVSFAPPSTPTPKFLPISATISFSIGNLFAPSPKSRSTSATTQTRTHHHRNSIHYVLDSDGRIIDALPGLYGAQAFLAGLQQAEGIANQCSISATGERTHILHEIPLRPCSRAQNRTGPANLAPLAHQAPSSSINTPPTRNSKPHDDSAWASIAALHSDQARLDQASRALLMAKAPSASPQADVTASKIAIEIPSCRQIRNLERSISETLSATNILPHQKFTNGSRPILPRKISMPSIQKFTPNLPDS